MVGSNPTSSASLENMLSTDTDGVLVAVRVKPRAPAAKVEGERGGRLLVAVTAPPVDGKANDAVCRLLAKTLGVAGGRVSVVSGERARDKLVRIDGVQLAEVAGTLGINTA
jgi:uncharacterized protein (TIGR00251 family)